MTAFCDINFDIGSANRFKDQTSTLTVTNNGVIIDHSDFWAGDASGRFLNSNLTLSDDDSFNWNDASNDISIDMYVKVVSDKQHGLIGQYDDNDNRWHLILDTTGATHTLKFFARTTGLDKHDHTVNLSSNITYGKWNNIQVCTDNNDIYFFVNGVLLSTETDASSLININADVTVGYVNDGGIDRYFEGSMDDFKLDDSTLNTTTFSVETWSGEFTELDNWVDMDSGSFTFTDTTPDYDPTVLPTTGFPQNIPDFIQANNQLFVAGMETLFKIDGSTVLTVGVARPTGAPTTSAVTGSSTLTGTYEYRFTYLDTRGNESPPILAVVEETPSSQDVELTWTDTPPSRATDRVIYRRKSTQTDFIRVDIQAVTATTFTDDNADNIIEGGIIMPELDTEVPPPCNYMQWFKGRMYFIACKVDGTVYPTRVYYSEIDRPELTRPNNWFYVNQDDGEVLTGSIEANNNLFLFKEGSIYRIDSDPELSDFALIPVTNKVGAISNRTIKESDGRVIFTADEGVYLLEQIEFSVFRSTLISDMIEPLIEAVPTGRKPLAQAGLDTDKGLYLLAISQDSSDFNDKIFCLNYRESLLDGVPRWTVWDVPSYAMNEGKVDNTNNQRAIYGTSDNQVGYFDDTVDLNQGITWFWQTGNINQYGNGFQHVREIRALVNINTVNPVLLEWGSGELIERLRTNSYSFIAKRLGLRTDYISPIFKVYDDRETVKYRGLSLRGNLRGRRNARSNSN